MKKSEMVEHIAAEFINAIENSEHSNESEEKYYKRKAADILDMMLGFGMLPPNLTGTAEVEVVDEGVSVSIWGWEAEDEKK